MTHATEALELLTLKSLRTLAAAIQGGSLTRAAVERGLAQSAVSRQIAELERALGGALFCDRRYNHVFTYHNGAESYYGVRGFRAKLRI